jgi:hypothetical protein
MSKVVAMREATPHEVGKFKACIKGQNFLTPIIVGYFANGRYVIELSTNGEDNPVWGELYGVTVLEDSNPARNAYELSKAFNSKADAIDYIRELGKCNKQTPVN